MSEPTPNTTDDTNAASAAGNQSADRPSRAWAKFLKHKPAMIAMVIIGIYVLTGFGVLWGLVDVDDTSAKFAAPTLPGFGLSQEPEKRVADAQWYLDQIRVPLSSIDPATALTEFPINGLKARGIPKQPKIELSDDETEEDAEAQKVELPADAKEAVEALKTELAEADKLRDELGQIPDLNNLFADGGAEADATSEKLAKLESLVDGMVERDVNIVGRALQVSLGTDRMGRSNFLRAVYSIRVAILVGLVTGLVSVLIGTFMGLIAGYFGGWVDVIVMWLYSTFASIPNIVLLIMLVFVFRGGAVDKSINDAINGIFASSETELAEGEEPAEETNWVEKVIGDRIDNTLIPVYVAFCATFWIGPCRIIRGEVLKLREQEYIQAAQVLGYNTPRILIRHLLPNVTHLMLINFSLLFIGAIKSEVILSFLGLGVQEGASWGLMISFAKDEVVQGNFWQIGVATAFMFVLVLAFNVLSDAMQDILDPKHV